MAKPAITPDIQDIRILKALIGLMIGLQIGEIEEKDRALLKRSILRFKELQSYIDHEAGEGVRRTFYSWHNRRYAMPTSIADKQALLLCTTRVAGVLAHTAGLVAIAVQYLDQKRVAEEVRDVLHGIRTAPKDKKPP